MTFFKKLYLHSLCCRLSIYSYKNPNDLIDTFNNANDTDILSEFSKPNFYSSGLDAQCFTTTYRNYLFVVFRGTESNQDILTNLNFIPHHMKEININNKKPYVHKGFLQQFRSLLPFITIDFNNFISNFNNSTTYNNDLTDFNNNNHNNNNHNYIDNPYIIFTGYSLGAALATISSLYFGYKYNLNIDCFTYGSPKVGNKHFVELFNLFVSNNFRYVNQEDPVTFIPFKGFNNFFHTGPMLLLDRNNNIIKSNNSSLFFLFKKFFCKLCSNNPFIYHNSDIYYHKLLKNKI
jgi:hypothetical protein